MSRTTQTTDRMETRFRRRTIQFKSVSFEQEKIPDCKCRDFTKADMLKVIENAIIENEMNLLWGLMFLEKEKTYHLVKTAGEKEMFFICSKFDYEHWIRNRRRAKGVELETLDVERVENIFRKISNCY